VDTGLRVHIQHQTWDSNDIFPFSIAKKGDSNDIDLEEVRWYRYDIVFSLKDPCDPVPDMSAIPHSVSSLPKN
jgi:hypothetical protein